MKFMVPRPERPQKHTTVRAPDESPAETEARSADAAQRTPHGRWRWKKAPAIAAALIAALLLGAVPVTYSYLTASSETVVNTFAGGAISLTLDEAKVDTDGNPLEDEPRVQENSYKVLPGATLFKDPTVTVLEGSEVCYVFLYVENPLDEEYFTLDYSEDWIKVASTGTKTLYVYQTTVDASDGDVTLSPIFTTITVSSELTSEQIEEMGEVQIKVQAYAVQAQGVDSETAIQMATAYFEAEFDFSFSDVDTTVEIVGSESESAGEAEENASDVQDDVSGGEDADAGDTDASDADDDSGGTEDAGTSDGDAASDSAGSEEDDDSGTQDGADASAVSDGTSEEGTSSEPAQ